MSTRGGHHYLGWESQPLLRSTARPRGYGKGVLAAVFFIGLLVGLII